MDYKNLSTIAYDETIMFLDKLQSEYKKKAHVLTGVDEKVAYLSKRKEIEKARCTLLYLHFTLEDYVKTGEINISEIVIPKPCKSCGK